MAQSTHLIMTLLRIITPEEVGEITTKHNGGKFLSLTDLLNERVQKKIYRNFSINQGDESPSAKILPFNPEADFSFADEEDGTSPPSINEDELKSSLTDLAKKMNESKVEVKEHQEDENMSTFILIEKARLKKSQHTLKQKEILELYQKNINVDVEQIRGQEENLTQSKESGILINKKQY